MGTERMAVHLNRVLPNAHFRKRKTWAKLAKTWFNQPAKKVTRRSARAAKAAQVAPRPQAGQLRPVVQCPTFRYNSRQRLGRGFTKQEIVDSGLTCNEARKIGICVDKRRRNKSTENLQRNVQRLKEYRSKLVILPKSGETDLEQCMARTIMPVAGIPSKAVVESASVSDAPKGSAYFAFHMARANAKYAGQRAKRAKAKAQAEADKAGRKK